MDIISYLQKMLPQLTSKQRAVAAVLLNDSRRASLMTVRELAEISEVSTATVLRLVQSLGFNQYRDMCRAFNELASSGPPLQKLRDGTIAESFKDPLFLQQIVSCEQENLSAFLTPFLNSNFTRAVKTLGYANNVCVIGARSAFSLAYYLGFLLQQFMERVTFCSSNADNIFEQIESLNKADVAIVFAFPRYSKSTVKVCRFLHERSVPLIAVTDSPLSPLTEYSRITLFCKNSSPFYSYTSAMCLCNGIILGLKEILGREFDARMKRVVDMLQNEKIYF